MGGRVLAGWGGLRVAWESGLARWWLAPAEPVPGYWAHPTAGLGVDDG
jgi:hypothetical protein